MINVLIPLCWVHLRRKRHVFLASGFFPLTLPLLLQVLLMIPILWADGNNWQKGLIRWQVADLGAHGRVVSRLRLVDVGHGRQPIAAGQLGETARLQCDRHLLIGRYRPVPGQCPSGHCYRAG